MGGMVGSFLWSLPRRTTQNVKDSGNEILRELPDQQPRVAALINTLNQQAAEKKRVSILFLSLVGQ